MSASASLRRQNYILHVATKTTVKKVFFVGAEITKKKEANIRPSSGRRRKTAMLTGQAKANIPDPGSYQRHLVERG